MTELKIIKETKNPLFNRVELELLSSSENAPTRAEVTKFIESKHSSHPDHICVESIKGKFGTREFKILARVYASKEDKEHTELKSQKQRKAEAEAAKKPAEAPAQ